MASCLLPVAYGLCLHCFDPAKQNGRLRHIAFSHITKDLLAIDQNGEVATLPGPDFRFDSKLFLRCLLQAHGCMAQVQSKETTDDFDGHTVYTSTMGLIEL